VEVALEAAPFLVRDLHEPQARRLELFELLDEIAVEPVPFHGNPNGRHE
jgi:hypothetical protein